MTRLKNAQKQLAQSLAALESVVEQAQNSITFAVTYNSAGTADADRSHAVKHSAQAIDIDQLSQDLTAIEADLETAMKMIDNLMAPVLSSGQDKDSL